MKGSHGWIGMKNRKRVLKIIVSILSFSNPLKRLRFGCFRR
jgi:hypothetical protein